MLRYLTAGESHGEALIGIVEGMPAGTPVTAGYIDRQLARRWQGYGRGGRAKFEQDAVHIYSGVRFSKSIGSPIALRVDNAAFKRDKSGWPAVMSTSGTGEGVDPVTLPRPGHADLVGLQKYGFDDLRPVIERSSARETAVRVACCSVARQFLAELGIEVGSHVVRIGEAGYAGPEDWHERISELADEGAEMINAHADESEVRMLDGALTNACIDHIRETKERGDSLGGIYEVVVTGVPAGLGSYAQWDRRLDARLGMAVLSIQGQKAVEIGDGVANVRRPGSKVHDEIVRAGKGYRRATNRAGGVEGGISNGMPIVVRGYMKPIPTLIKPLGTVDIRTGQAQPTRYERSDVTSVPAASTVAESVIAFAIAEAILETYGGDSLKVIRTRFEAG